MLLPMQRGEALESAIQEFEAQVLTHGLCSLEDNWIHLRHSGTRNHGHPQMPL